MIDGVDRNALVKGETVEITLGIKSYMQCSPRCHFVADFYLRKPSCLLESAEEPTLLRKEDVGKGMNVYRCPACFSAEQKAKPIKDPERVRRV